MSECNCQFPMPVPVETTTRFGLLRATTTVTTAVCARCNSHVNLTVTDDE